MTSSGRAHVQGEHGRRTIDSDDDLDSSDDEDDAPRLDTIKLSHSAAVNRIRVMPQDPRMIAAWSDTGLAQAISTPSQAPPMYSTPAHS